MPTRKTAIWKRIGKTVGYQFTQSYVRRFSERHSVDALLDVDLYMQDYLGTYPSEKGSASAPFELAKMIDQGEWPPPPAPPTPPPALIPPVPLVGLSPLNFSGDSLVDEMPVLIQNIVAHRLQGTEICTDFAIAGALATVAACAGNRLRVSAWGDTYLANDYFLLVGETGTSFKSSVLHRVRQILSEAADGVIAPDEGSWERLVTHMEDHPGCIWLKDELAGLLGEIKGRDYMRGFREMILTLHNHAGVYRRGVMRHMYAVNNPALTLLTTIQPFVLGEELVTGRHIEAGLLNRFLIVYGKGAPSKWLRLEGAREVGTRIVERLRKIAESGVTEVEASHLEDGANEWRGREIEEFGEYGEAVARRASSHAIKLAAILQAAEQWPKERIDERWLYVAMGLLGRWFRSAAELLASVHIKQAREIERRDLLRFVERSKNGGRTRAEMSKFMQTSVRQLDDHLDALIERGDLRAWTDDDGSMHWRAVIVS